MITRLIVFLIRMRLGLKLGECFQFKNQKSNAVYFFTRTGITKCWRGLYVPSGISLTWLLDSECKKMLIRRKDVYVADGVIRCAPGTELK
jgi:hypothetical protein